MKVEIIKYALKNLWNRKSRSLLTILSILIGISAIFIFASFGIGLYSYVDEIAGEAGIDLFFVQQRSMGAPGLDDTFILDADDLKAIERTKGVEQAAAMYMKAAEVEQERQKKYAFIIGYEDEEKDIAMIDTLFNVEVIEGRQFKKGDRGKVVLGYNYQLPDKIFSKPYQVGQKITINGKRFEIIGFYSAVGNPSDDANIYVIEDDMLTMYGEDISYGFIIGKVDDPEEMDTTISRIKKELRKTRGLEEGKEDFFVQSYEDTIDMYMSVLNVIIGFIFLIVLISAIVASVNTANTMVTSVLERVKEIGVMKSIGARNSEIRNIFLFEASTLGIVAGMLGVFVGWLLASVGGNILDQLGWGFLSPKFHPSLFIICILLATVVGAISGMAPAIYASKQKPVDALRYE